MGTRRGGVAKGPWAWPRAPPPPPKRGRGAPPPPKGRGAPAGMGEGLGWVVLVLAAIGSCGVKGSAPLAPPFLEEPANQSVLLGEEAELRCRARVGVAVQWSRGGLMLGATPTRAHPRYRLVGDPAKGEHHLRIRPVTLEDDDAFSCQAGEGSGSRASRTAQISVLVPPSSPRLELLEGAELPLLGGAEVRVRCHAHDARPAPTLRLRLGEEPLADVSSRVFEGSHPKLSSAEATARLVPVPALQGRLLLCSASNAAGPAPGTATLRLHMAVPPSAPSIAGLPPLVRAGEELRMRCESRGGRPPPSLHWDKDGLPLAGAWSEDEGGVATSRLVLRPAPEDDGAILRCRAVTSLPGGGASTSVTLRVAYGPSELAVLGSGAVPEGGEAELSCTSAPSNPPVRLRWWLGGARLSAHSEGRTPGGGAYSNVTLRGRGQDHGAALVCEAETPGVGTKSVSVTVSVSHPPQDLWVEAPPPNATFRAGEGLRLLCHARGGHPAPKLTWTKDGRALPEAPPQSRSGHVTSRALHVTLAPSDNGANFRCEAAPVRQGAAPTRSAPVRMRVIFPAQSVSISVSPREPRPGHALTVTCRAGPAHPAPELTWIRPGHAPEPGLPLPPSPAPHGGVTAGSRLLLQGALELHDQPITCRAWSARLGVAVSSAHVLRMRHAPVVSAGPSPVVVPEGSEAVLGLSVRAHPPPEGCAWSTAGRGINPEGSPRFRLSPGGALVIANATRGDSAAYRVWCVNAEGGAGADVTLLVQVPPSIVRAPDPVVVDEGGEGQLLCEARGSPLPPGSVTWARLGDSGSPLDLPPGLEPLPGGPGGALRVSGARRDLGGPYECRVDSGVPPPARAIVRLLVRYGPEMEAEPEEGAGPGVVLVPEGAESATLRCRARGVPGVELNWESNGRSLRAGEPGSPFRQLQWREGPWTSSELSVTNVTGARARLRRLFLLSHPSRPSHRFPPRPRARYRYQNVPPAPPDWEHWEHWEHWEGTNGTVGVFDCVGTNERGTARRRLRLQMADRPDPPRSLRLSGLSGTSLSLAWDPGWDGGLAQHFLLRADGPDAPPPPAHLVTSGFSLTLGGLQPDTPYDVTVRARNARGESAPVRLRAVTSAVPEAPPPVWAGPEAPPGGGEDAAVPVLQGALGAMAGTLLAAVGAGLGCCYFRWGRGRRRRARTEAGEETPSPEGSWGPPSLGSAPWDLPKGAEPHLYEEVEPWGGYEEVPPEPLVTPQGELV
ncbi:nephrin [Ammospiza nelsoni]|uniref:nephrin n=1 Tax=Ammospiza nelsoni TaxID=2857394 RepID=UPI00286A5597|nr:nephrin [Ammospiza nelsoni]